MSVNLTENILKVLKGRLVTFKVSHFTILAFGMLVGQTFQ